jgi:hypothetical protein
MAGLKQFGGTPEGVKNKLNAMVDALNPLADLRVDEQFMTMAKTPAGVNIGLNINQVLAAVAKDRTSIVEARITSSATWTGSDLSYDIELGHFDMTTGTSTGGTWTADSDPYTAFSDIGTFAIGDTVLVIFRGDDGTDLYWSITSPKISVTATSSAQITLISGAANGTGNTVTFTTQAVSVLAIGTSSTQTITLPTSGLFYSNGTIGFDTTVNSSANGTFTVTTPATATLSSGSVIRIHASGSIDCLDVTTSADPWTNNYEGTFTVAGFNVTQVVGPVLFDNDGADIAWTLDSEIIITNTTAGWLTTMSTTLICGLSSVYLNARRGYYQAYQELMSLFNSQGGVVTPSGTLTLPSLNWSNVHNVRTSGLGPSDYAVKSIANQGGTNTSTLTVAGAAVFTDSNRVMRIEALSVEILSP